MGTKSEILKVYKIRLYKERDFRGENGLGYCIENIDQVLF